MPPTNDRQMFLDESKRLLDKMQSFEPDTKEYKDLLDNLKALTPLLPDQPRKETKSISPDTIVNAVTYIFGIVLILNFEKLDVLRSRATGFMPRLK
jgi:hypothetical protein